MLIGLAQQTLITELLRPGVNGGLLMIFLEHSIQI